MEKTVNLVNAMPTAGWIVLGIAIVLVNYRWTKDPSASNFMQ